MEKGANGEFVPKMTITKSGTIDSRQSSFVDTLVFIEIFNHIERMAKKTGDELLAGDIKISPIDGRDSPACKYCDFASICGIENKTPNKVPSMTNKEVLETLVKEENGSGMD
jgi:ATP-dependent helicase/nuclease subunit B